MRMTVWVSVLVVMTGESGGGCGSCCGRCSRVMVMVTVRGHHGVAGHGCVTVHAVKSRMI
jgi:hypothetical protein